MIKLFQMARIIFRVDLNLVAVILFNSNNLKAYFIPIALASKSFFKSNQFEPYKFHYILSKKTGKQNNFEFMGN